MLSKAVLCVAIGAPVTVVLQGCGGGGGGGTTAGPSPSHSTSSATTTTTTTLGPSPSHSTSSATTTTTTTTTLEPRTPGWTAQEAVQELNNMYMAFNASDDTSAVGVTISFAGQTDSFDSNLYCNRRNRNQLGYVNSSCYNGLNDCRMSGAVINHKVMVRTQGDGSVFVPLMDRSIGYIFNQTLTEDYFGKCTFLYDGADSYNVNFGCGAIAPRPWGPGACENNPNSAFYDMCANGGDTYHHCTATDSEVTSRFCQCETCSPAVANGVVPPRFKSDDPCFYEMPALFVDYDDPSSFTPSGNNNLRQAMKQRVQSDNVTNQQQEWNEIVIDERLLIPKMWSDPTHTIVAFFYVSGGSTPAETAQQQATNMRNGFQQAYSVNVDVDIPVVEIDAQHDFTSSGGPFKLPPQQRRVVV